MKACNNCPYKTNKKTKYGEYSWCKLYGCSTSSPKNPCNKQENEQNKK
jgi:hypothetical protein